MIEGFVRDLNLTKDQIEKLLVGRMATHDRRGNGIVTEVKFTGNGSIVEGITYRIGNGEHNTLGLCSTQRFHDGAFSCCDGSYGKVMLSGCYDCQYECKKSERCEFFEEVE